MKELINQPSRDIQQIHFQAIAVGAATHANERHFTNEYLYRLHARPSPWLIVVTGGVSSSALKQRRLMDRFESEET
jgi:hypothetical protein